MRIALASLLIVLAAFSGVPGPAFAQDTPENEVRIGVLAFRGWRTTEPQWKPLERYIARQLGQPTRLVPVTLASAGPLIDNGGVHFLVTNPGHYVDLARTRPMSVLATRKRRLSDGSYVSEFGSAIITSADSPIDSLKQATGQRVTAISPNAFGGFQVAWAAFVEQGIDPFSDFAALDFVGFPMDRIIDDVRAGRTEIGIIRSGLIEELAAEGKLDPAQIKVLNANASYTYPDTLSTRLYPEWPFLAMSGTDEGLRDRMALALLATQDATLRTTHGLRDGWGAPRSYHAVVALSQAYAARLDRQQRISRLLLPGLIASAALIGALLGLWMLSRRRKPAPAAPAPTADRPAVALTQREREVLDLVTQGLSSKQIARQLGISPKTVEFHRSNLLRKYDTNTTAELVHKAAQSLAKQAPTAPT
ncbi:PhnD/SsuA/transferrin family substrate-binding protein [Marimonas lutisalis]|uniref:PhnD/SsuA/transferrin family substrate-binding protein n=1 Tax=Marimonas lutisalis TaxID=2545756 RepID=UPI0013760DC6|nr:PhnD/SsuA/transferrin family substrate-binding protein [Marimonas lutisalis]